MRFLFALALWLALTLAVGTANDPEVAFYQHLERWHHITGTISTLALTSHGPRHAVAPQMPFFFFVDPGAPEAIRDYMGGLIAPIQSDGSIGDPTLIVQARCLNFLVGDLPSIAAGFNCQTTTDGQQAIVLSKDNLLPLPVGRYCAVFFQLIPVSERKDNCSFVTANPDIIYSWEFAIDEGGENLFDLANGRPAPSPYPTPLPKWLEPTTNLLPTIGIGRRI